MPTLKAIHICNSHRLTRKQKIAKEYDFANADGLEKKKYDRTTLCIVHSTLRDTTTPYTKRYLQYTIDSRKVFSRMLT